MLDKMKVPAAILLLLGGVFGYYVLPAYMGEDVSILLRVAVIFVAVVLAAVVFFTSDAGKASKVFGKGALIELKKMIWPTKQETIQGTIMVVVLVILFSLFLWLVDTASFKAIYGFILSV